MSFVDIAHGFFFPLAMFLKENLFRGLMNSGDVSNAYYDRIGAEGLLEQADDERTAMEVKYLLGLLADDDVLDVACGYGRVARPLAERGCRVTGVDVSSCMVDAARSYMPDVPVVLGDMRSLPFGDGSFSVVLCLWSSFNSLLFVEDQRAALDEFFRVLRPGGWALLDVPDGDKERWDLRHRGTGVDGHLIKDYFVGDGNMVYLHDGGTLTLLCEQTSFSSFSLLRKRFGGTRRLLVLLRRDEVVDERCAD